MSAIEVLKEMKKFWIEGIELNKRNGDKTSPKELAELNALDKAIVALEQKEDDRKQGAIAQKKKDEIDFIRLEVMPKSKKKQYRVFFKDGTEQVFPIESRVVKQNE